MIIQRQQFIEVLVMDNWGNSYPFNKRFQTTEEAHKWLRENFESYILSWLKQSARDSKHKIKYPDAYIIRQRVTNEVKFVLKPHEFDEDLTSKLEPEERLQLKVESNG